MLPLPSLLSADYQRAIIVLLPFLMSGVGILILQPNKRLLTGIFLAGLWNLVILIPVNLFAIHMGWWEFSTDKPLLLNLPIDVLFGWSVWWGTTIFLIFQGRYLLLALATGLWIDLLLMPHLAPLIILGKNWLWGETLVLATCFLPGWYIASFTIRDIHVNYRAWAQAVITCILLLIMLPTTLLEYSDRCIWEIFTKPAWYLSLALNILLLPIILGLAGNQEFAERGHGTPIPFDPPKHLVVTGPYAYVANPMQISIVLSLIILGIAYQSALVACASLVAIFYCLGIVQWHHTIDMQPRFGKKWLDYRCHVKDWFPRWKPWICEPSTVFFARYCNICQDTEHWLIRLNPVGLRIEDASQHPKSLDRVTYRYPDGSEVYGIYAIASCLNHTNFAFAFFGWFMRLPIIRHFLQLLMDGTGERAETI